MNTLAKASIGLFAALLLVAPAQAAGWSDWYATSDVDGGSMTISLSGQDTVSEAVTDGTFGGTAYHTTCGGADRTTVSFTIVTDAGVVQGQGVNGVGVWTWNGILFEGSAYIDVSGKSPGSWAGYAWLYLESTKGDINALGMSLYAHGDASGQYSYGQC